MTPETLTIAAAACPTVSGRRRHRNPICRSIALICGRVITTARWSPILGRRTSRTGFDATSRHSRRACSKAADNRESSRSTELPVTSRERWSRHAPMCSGVMCPTGRWMGSAA